MCKPLIKNKGGQSGCLLAAEFDTWHLSPPDQLQNTRGTAAAAARSFIWLVSDLDLCFTFWCFFQQLLSAPRPHPPLHPVPQPLPPPRLNPQILEETAYMNSHYATKYSLGTLLGLPYTVHRLHTFNFRYVWINLLLSSWDGSHTSSATFFAPLALLYPLHGVLNLERSHNISPPPDAGLKRQLFLIRFFSFFFVLSLLNSIPQRCSQGKAHGKRLSEYTAVILMEPFAVVKMPHIFLDQIKKIMPGAARPALNKMRRQRVWSASLNIDTEQRSYGATSQYSLQSSLPFLK